jgi:hypothetical protein
MYAFLKKCALKNALFKKMRFLKKCAFLKNALFKKMRFLKIYAFF